MNVVELFAGSGTMSKAFAACGHSTFKIDIRKRKGICEPDLRKDIFKCQRKDVPFEHIDIVWASVPCTAWSYGAGDYYIKNGELSDQAKYYFQMLIKSLRYIKLLKPSLYFIENPRGHLRYQKPLLDWLVKNNGMTKELTLGSYGFATTKPTNIFTNALQWQPRPLQAWGKYYSKCERDFSAMTLIKKQTLPLALCTEIVTYCEIFLNDKNVPGLKVSCG